VLLGRLTRARALVAALAVFALVSIARGDGEPVPWPDGGPPALVEQLEAATELMDRERYEEYLEAREHGEAREHITAFQWHIDAGELDLEALFTKGDSFFEHEFDLDDGLGDRAEIAPPERVHDGLRGGLDTFSCAGCHFVGGPDGAGAETQNAFLFGDGERTSSALSRNAPAVLGLGFVQALAREMTIELRAARDAAIARAIDTGTAQTIELATKGVSFGALSIDARGAVDTSALAGIDADLEVKPFGWKGTLARLRRFAEDAARVHFGIQSHPLALGHREEPDVERLGAGPDWWDPDADGAQRELEEGSLTAAAVYMAMLEVPVIVAPASADLRARWARGRELLRSIGCTDCHRETLPLESSRWSEDADSEDSVPVEIDLLRDGEAPRGTLDVELFSDLRRHHMGEELRESRDDPSGVAAAVFLTRPLWGLAESPPYLHDGRAQTIPEAILAHGGEAQASRDAFAALDSSDRADLHVFLLSLSRTPRVRYAR
jgi:hypothetical protein